VTSSDNAADFVYTDAVYDEMEFNLLPALAVAESGTTDLTLFVSLDAWFRDSGGSLVDPLSANPGGPNQGLVEQNIKSALEALRG
jgi:hypothetical protein